MHISVVIRDAFEGERYDSNVTTKWWIYHHKKVISILAQTFPQELKIRTSRGIAAEKVMIEHVVKTELTRTNKLKLDNITKTKTTTKYKVDQIQ